VTEKPDIITCEKCGRVLDPDEAVWIEWDTRLGGPAKTFPVPPEHSQGAFPYGRDCAKKLGFKETTTSWKKGGRGN
jgi:hypothetical protein